MPLAGLSDVFGVWQITCAEYEGSAAIAASSLTRGPPTVHVGLPIRPRCVWPIWANNLRRVLAFARFSSIAHECSLLNISACDLIAWRQTPVGGGLGPRRADGGRHWPRTALTGQNRALIALK